MKKLSILGSTGSIGKSTLDLVDLYPDRFQVSTLAARKSVDALYDQALKYRPQLIALWDEEAARELRGRLPQIEVLSGLEGVTQAAIHPSVDTVVAAIEGAAGLVPTYRALLEKKDIALGIQVGSLELGRQNFSDDFQRSPERARPAKQNISIRLPAPASGIRKNGGFYRGSDKETDTGKTTGSRPYAPPRQYKGAPED